MIARIGWVLIALLMACGGAAPARPGSAAVYDRSGALTSCAELQREFDIAEANFLAAGSGREAQRQAALSYMKAAEERRQQIRC